VAAGQDGGVGDLLIDTQLVASPDRAHERARALAATGVDGLFTFEGPWDVFVPLVLAAEATDRFLYSNVAIAFPRSPMHLATMANDLQTLSGGRFALGLGTQVQAHVERRYGAAWGRPVAHMAEWVAAVRAIQARWQHGTPLDFQGEWTTHTLLPPTFDPGPNPHGPPPVWLGALGPQMTALAARSADGLLIHPFSTERHLTEVTLSRFDAALAAAGRPRGDVTVVGQAILSVGRTDEELAAADAAVRGLLGFYGSTPAYRPVLDTHGWGDLQPRLRQLTKEGRWDELASLVDDDVLGAIAVRGTPADVAAELRRRFAGRVDRVGVYTPSALADDVLAEVVERVRAG
jgi:probable F420-dependent oxidoreductase